MSLASTVVTSHPPNATQRRQRIRSGAALDRLSISGRSLRSRSTVSDDFGHVSGDAVVDIIDLGGITVTVSHPIALALMAEERRSWSLTGAATASDDFGSINDAVVDVINLGATRDP